MASPHSLRNQPNNGAASSSWTIGRDDAAARLVEEHEVAVFSFLRARVGSASAARVLCLEVLVAVGGRGGLTSNNTILRRQLLEQAENLLGKYAAQQRDAPTIWRQAYLAAQKERGHARLSEEADQHILADQRILDDLEPSQRQVLQFCYGAGLSHQEIGQRMRRSETAVQTLLDKARGQFILRSEHLPEGLPHRAARNELTDQDIQQLNALLRQADTGDSAALEELAAGLALEEFLWRANGRSQLSVVQILKRIRRRRLAPVAAILAAALVVLLAGLYWVAGPKQDKSVVLHASKQPLEKKTASPQRLASPHPANRAGIQRETQTKKTSPAVETEPLVAPPSRPVEKLKAPANSEPWAAVLQNETPPMFLDVCFHDSFRKSGSPPRAELMKWLTPAADATGVITETRRRYGRTALIRGVFRLNSPWRDDAGFRFAVSANGVFQIHAFQGQTGLSFVRYERNGVTWAAYKTRRAKGASRPLSRVLAVTDNGRANRTGALGGGPYELRWRQGQLLLSRGDVVVLAAPMERPPQDVYLAGQATVEGLELVKTSDFPLLSNLPATAKAVDLAASPAWQKYLADGARWQTPQPGVWKLTRPAAGANAWACTPLEQQGPYEAVLAVSHFTAGAGVCLGASPEDPQWVVRFQENERGGGLGAAIVSPRDRRLHQTFPLPEKEPSPLVGEHAWLRLVFGCGVMKCWVGVDGQHWAELGSAKISGRIGWIGLHCSAGKSSCHIQLEHLTLRELPHLKRLAGKDIWKQVRRTEADDLSQWKRQVLAQRPAEFDAADWLRASILASLSGGGNSTLSHALLDALLDSVQENLAAEQYLKVLGEAALLIDCNQQGRLQPLLERYHRLGRRVLNAGRTQPFSFIRPALMTAPIRTRRVVLLGGEELMRAELLAGAASGKWEEVARSSQQFQFFHLEERVPLQPWAAAISHRRRGLHREQGDSTDSGKRFPERWRHPGNIPIDRRAYDIAANLDSLLASKSVSAAARRIVALDFSRALGLTPRDENLFISPLVLTPTLLRSNRALRKAFQQEAADVALLQVRQAMQDRDAHRLNDLATQFETTPAARLAHRWLGDFALSRGAFRQARDHYRNALPRNTAAGVEAPGSNDLVARLQLTQAYLEARPARDGAAAATFSTSVRFGGKQFSQQQFNAMTEHVRRRTFSHQAKTEPTLLARKAIFATRRFTFKSYGPFALAQPQTEANQPHAPASPLSRVTQVSDPTGRIALFSNPYGVAAFDIPNARLLWSDQTFAASGKKAEENLLAATAAVSDSTVFVRRQGRQGVLLIAYDIASGEIAWVSESSPDHQLVSDPLVVENRVIGITAKSAPVEGIELFATHWDHDSGAVVEQHKLLDLRAAPIRRLAAGLVRTPNGFLAAVGGCLIGWETNGRLLWVRRQFMAPPEDAESWRRGVAMVRCSGEQGSEHLMVSQPGAPEICCVDQNTGALLWRRVFPELSATPSKLGQTLLVREKFSMQALNQNTGATLWRRSVAERAVVSPMPTWNAVAVTTSDAAEKRLEWFDAATGARRGAAAVAGADDASLQTLFAFSGRLFGVLPSRQNTGHSELVELLAR